MDFAVSPEWRIPKPAYVRLVRFCQHYPEWKHDYENYSMRSRNPIVHQVDTRAGPSDPTSQHGLNRAEFSERIALVENAAKKADSDIWMHVITGVVYNYAPQYLKYQCGMKCSYDRYLIARAKFFWILNSQLNTEM